MDTQPPPDFPWPEAIVFLGDDCSLYIPPVPTPGGYDSLSVTLFTIRKSRAFPEHDLPSPVKMGRKLYALRPGSPVAKPTLLLDAGRGAIGSPSVSFDGRWIYVSMAREGESFFHIYRIPAAGGEPQRLTDGPFHDIDPAELPDGRLVFASTRIGYFEEYHSPPSRALFVMNADGRNIKPITHTIIFDNEPEVMADGRIIFIRSDNFFGRGKVETLLHAIHPDGTNGNTEFGLDNAPEYGMRLRALNVGSPAPLPDGRVAFVSGPGITVGWPGRAPNQWQHISIEAGDSAALPDGRLLCTVPRRPLVEVAAGSQKRSFHDYCYDRIVIVDPNDPARKPVVVHDAQGQALHSPVYLGARPRPPVLAHKVDPRQEDQPGATGFLYCQDARFTQNGTAGWPHVRAIRVLAGKGLTTRSSHAYIVHAGNETIELGTVPLALDGSFAIEVPADTPLALQAVDAEGRSELNEMSWIFVRPGERRGCVGCHQPRQSSPQLGAMQAMRTRPLKLLGQGQPHRFRGNNAAVTGLMEMQFDRFREIAGIDRFKEVKDVPGQLKSADPGLRISTAQRLAIHRDPAAANALAERLGDDNREARVAATLALASCGTRDSIPPLLGALTDPDPLVAQAATVALENLTGRTWPFDPFASATQRRLQADAWREGFSAMGWDRIETELIQRLENTDRDIVRRAAVALGHIGSDPARAALRTYVQRERDQNPFTAWRADRRNHGDGAQFNALSPANPRTLQAATRALGHLGDVGSVPMLTETLLAHSDPATGNLFLAEAAIEALGRIRTPEAESALVAAFAAFKPYPRINDWYGDHDALIACHASPLHGLVIQALDAMASTRATSILPHLICSVPTDPDRALLLNNDDYETLVGRILRRHGREAQVVETCLALLGDPQAKPDAELSAAISATHSAWGGKPDPQNRAAQVLSLTCRDKAYEPRIRAAFDRFRTTSIDGFARVSDTALPAKLPARHWVCFFLARAMGNLADAQSVDSLLAALADAPEAATGHPDPAGPGVLFLHNDLTPCWRAAAAWALGQIGDRRAAPALVNVVADLKNATDTRHAAAEALAQLGDTTLLPALRALAANYPEVSTRRALLHSAARIEARR